MRNLALSFAVSILTATAVLFVFLTGFVKVCDLQKVVFSLEQPILSQVGRETNEEILRKRKIVYKAVKKALSEQRGIVLLKASVLKGNLRDVTDEVLERSRYWYAYYLSYSQPSGGKGGNK